MCDAKPKTNGSPGCPAAPGVSLTEASKGPTDGTSCRRIRRSAFVLGERCVVSSVIEQIFLGENMIYKEGVCK